MMLSSLSITMFYCLRFDKKTPGVLYGKDFFFCVEENVFGMFVGSADANIVRRAAESSFVDSAFLYAVVPREHVKSAQE